MTNTQKNKTKQKKVAEWRLVSLTIAGKYLDPEKVADTLNIEPEYSAKKGDIFTKNKKWKHGYWMIGGGPERLKAETQIK